MPIKQLIINLYANKALACFGQLKILYESPLVLGLIYILSIPIFSLYYTLVIPSDFIHSNIKNEEGYLKDLKAERSKTSDFIFKKLHEQDPPNDLMFLDFSINSVIEGKIETTVVVIKEAKHRDILFQNCRTEAYSARLYSARLKAIVRQEEPIEVNCREYIDERIEGNGPKHNGAETSTHYHQKMFDSSVYESFVCRLERYSDLSGNALERTFEGFRMNCGTRTNLFRRLFDIDAEINLLQNDNRFKFLGMQDEIEKYNDTYFLAILDPEVWPQKNISYLNPYLKITDLSQRLSVENPLVLRHINFALSRLIKLENGIQVGPSLNVFFRMTYFSAVTITTLGFGDISPISNHARLVVGFESILGIVLIGLFLNACAHKIVSSARAGNERSNE